MSSLYVKRSDIIRSLFDYLEGKKTIGQCIDDTQSFDIDEILKKKAEEIASQMCDQYCRFPYENMPQEEIDEKICHYCPLNRLVEYESSNDVV